MSTYELELFGSFNEREITAIVDQRGQYWFTQDLIADALGVDRTALTHVRNNHPEEFTENIDYSSIVFDGRRRLVYSEEGFFTICDMSTSEVAYRLRKWMRQQFRARQSGNALVIQPKPIPRDDLSDLGPDLVLLQGILDTIAQHRRQMLRLDHEQRFIAAEQKEIKGTLQEHERRLQFWEEGARVKPGELTAIQVAEHCGWRSRAGGPHNVAVILAAINHGMDEDGHMVERREQGPDGMVVAVQVFTPDGFAKFRTQIDSAYHTGQHFVIHPNERAVKLGYKNKRNVQKM